MTKLYKKKTLSSLEWLYSFWLDANDSCCAKEEHGIDPSITGIHMIWDWSVGTRREELPFKNIPITIKDIWRVKKNYSLISKIKTMYRMCIEPLCRREVHWTTEFGSSQGANFFTFDWLTLKIRYENSTWTADTFQEEKFYERYLWQKKFRNYKTKFFKHCLSEKHPIEMNEWDFYKARDEHYQESCKDLEGYCDY